MQTCTSSRILREAPTWLPPANACWGKIPKPLRSPPAVTAARSANAVFHTDTKRKSCANGFPIHTAFLLSVYLAKVNFQNISLSPSAKMRGGRFTVSRGNSSGGKGKNAGGRSVQAEEGGKKSRPQGSFKRAAAVAHSGRFFLKRKAALTGLCLREAVPIFSAAASGSDCVRCCCAFFKGRLSKTKPKRSRSRLYRFQKKKPPGRRVSAVKTGREADCARLSKKRAG